PPTPPLGIGSANLTVDATGRQIIGTANYAGTRLDDITNLRYRSHQVSANPAVAPSLQFDMDYDTTDGNTAWQGRLVYEPYMSGTVQQNTWQTWDPLAGMWWSTSAPGNASCPQADPCTWAEVLAAFPNAGIRPPSLNGGVIFKAGGPVGSSLVSHVDGFEIGINTANTTFDFDAGRPTVTIDQAAGQGDPTSDAAIDFTATFSEAVTGFDASDVVIGGTAGPTTVQVTGGPTVYNVAVSGMTGSGTVTASIVDSAAVNGANSPTQASTSADNTVTYFTCNTVSIPTGITTLRNQQVSVPLNVDDVTGRGAFTSDLTVTYNASVLSYVGIDTAGTIADGSTITVNSLNPGVLVISVFNGNADFTGSGTFLSLRFLANGAIGTTSAMNFSGFIFNNGVPCVNTSNGLVTVISSAVSGQVDYVNSPTPKVVPGTTLTGIGVSGPTVNAVTDAAGQYSLSGFGAGAYTVTPSKAGDVNGITSFDAGQVARHTVGLITLNSNQLLAADVSQDGTINSFDAGNIARFIVGNPSHASTGSWRFVPASRNYSSVETAQANQNYGGILLGDVDGSWTPPSPFAELAAEPEETPNDIRFVANDLRAAPGTTVTIPISVANFADKGIFDYQFEIAFDPNVLEARGDLASLVGTLSEGSSVTAYSPEPGIVRVAVYGVTPITADGTLVNLHLAVIGGKGSSTPIEIRLPVAGNGSLPVRVTNGSLAVESAAERSLMGTVETADGQAIGRARVTLTDANGNSRTTVSSSFGQFEFGDLEPSQTYVISVNAKGHTFTPLTFTVGRESLRIAIRAQQ
ncbi:MAG: cohesin domain-containing protein, partial [Pyrinomonadaceae bacterium]|nr:cohesin domain-containing protein [Pyrinomonadaceae bacterium]